ncbi:MAG: sel1 repeat family protein [Sinorhizobium meliloti]|uniref:hypothetical protein n=1 Tax=Sinorhizobium TaxID=28105 RepID=UPI00035CDC70|nr:MULTISPECIES: hypothetical protein [Sinorhizobium]MCG5483346.1 sel1 repeat family protein [Sinorhizobium meliloti]PND22358.1 hypothetical protein CN934_05410 [Ensifer sp. MMN_5]PND27013.1 hypothetical protein CN933_14990 [Sinorhizobium sp. M4_45]RVQ04197.1 sel1 repeat family protein [Sinorhizobium meliloti]
MTKYVESSLRTGLHHLLAAAVLLPLFAIMPSAARASDLTAAEQCDREAGSEFDLERNRAFPAVATQDIRIGVALSACREAYNQNGGARTQFQLARVLDKAGQKLQSARILAEAAANGHVLAMASYAHLLAERGMTGKSSGDLLTARRFAQATVDRLQ